MAASAETIRAMASFLGIDAETEPQLLWLAEKAIIAPLPPGWVEYEEDGVTYYANGHGEAAPTTYEHPNDKLFAQLVDALRVGAFEKCGWEIHWADDGLPYFFHALSTTTQWTIPHAVIDSFAASEPEPEPELKPEPTVKQLDSDSSDEELLVKLHAQQARALKAKSRRARAKGRRERERKQQEADKRMRIIVAELKAAETQLSDRYGVNILQLEGVNGSSAQPKAGDPGPQSSRSSRSGSTVVSAQTDSQDEAYVQKLRNRRKQQPDKMHEEQQQLQEQKATLSARSAGSGSTAVSAQTDSDDEAFVRAHRTQQIEKRQAQSTTERQKVVQPGDGRIQQAQEAQQDQQREDEQHKLEERKVELPQPIDLLTRAQSSAALLRELEQLADSPVPEINVDVQANTSDTTTEIYCAAHEERSTLHLASDMSQQQQEQEKALPADRSQPHTLGGSGIADISAVTLVSPTVDATLLRALAQPDADNSSSVWTDEDETEDMSTLSPRTLERIAAEKTRAVTRRRMFPIPAKDAQTARYSEPRRPQTAPAASGKSTQATQVKRDYDKPWLQEAMIQKIAKMERAQSREQRKQEWRQQRKGPQQYNPDDDNPFGLDDFDSDTDDCRDTEINGSDRIVQIVEPDHLALLSVGSTMRRAKESYESYEEWRRYKEEKEEEAGFQMSPVDHQEVTVFDPSAVAKSQAALRQKRARLEAAGRLRPAMEWGGATARARAMATQQSAQAATSQTEDCLGHPHPMSAIARQKQHPQAAPSYQPGVVVDEAANKVVTIRACTPADRSEVKRLVYDYPKSVLDKQYEVAKRREAARGTESARRRAERRVAETRGLVAKSPDKGVEASEEARWRAAAVRREQKRARAQVSAGLCKAIGKETANLAAAAGQTLKQYDMSKQLEKIIQAEVEASSLQEVERLLRLVGIPPPELGQGGKTIRTQLLVDAMCNGFVTGFNPSRGTPFAATALYDSIDRTFATEHARAVSAGRTRRNRVKQARVGVAARAAQRASLATTAAQQSSDLQHYTHAERRAAFRREFDTHHRPSSAGPERARRLRAATDLRKPQDAWWPNTSQAFEGQRGGVDIPAPGKQADRFGSKGHGIERPRSAGIRRAQARRASILREQGRSNAPQFDPKTGRVVVEGENLELTPRWKNAFAEHDETVSGAPGDSNFGELVTAIKQKVEAAKRQMIKEAQIAEEQRIKQARKDAKQKHKDALLQRLAAGNLTPEEEEKIEMELEENLTLEEEEEIERRLQEPSDSLSCTTIASDDASRHEEYAASA